MTNKYSKVRLLLSVLLILPLFFVGLTIYNLPLEYINWLPVSLLLVGSLLFVFNKLWADIISYFGFIFLLVYAAVKLMLDFKQCRVDVVDSCVDYILEQFKLEFAILFPVLIFLILSYLSFEFYKRKYKVYK